MLPPFRPAVFGCPMRLTHGEKPKRVWPPPHPAWPEIADPSTYYTLPTLASHPAIEECFWSPRWESVGFAEHLTDREVIYLMFPDDAEELLAKLPPTTEDIYMGVLRLVGDQTASIGDARLFAARGIADPEWSVFAWNHELGHSFSFKATRPTILKVNRIGSGIFALFKKLTLTACENFWDEFHKCNDTLLRYLDKALIFEELRANFEAFENLDPIIRARIEPDLRKVMAKEGTISLFGRPILRTDLFDILAYITNEDWEVASWLTYLAEYSPADPLKRLYFLCKNGLNEYSAMILNVVITKKYKAGWKIQLVEPKHGTPEIQLKPPNEDADSTMHHLSLSDVRELVFLESLRQQLAQFSGVSLVCPFQQRGRTCCGFGHYLRAVWEKALPEYRSAKFILHPKTGKEIVVRPPHKACLDYCLG
jgi:hypothetical protein